MAAAFAALVSLQNNLHLISHHPRHSFSFEKEQIDSLRESVCFFIKFMKSFDDSHGATKEAAEALESQIARAAQAAEDVIESHVVDQIRAGSTVARKTKSRFLLDLQRAIEDMNYLTRKVVNLQNSQIGSKAEHPTFSATTSFVFEKDQIVGFDNQLLRLLDMLTKVPSSRQVIPIVGMGGIGKTTLAKNAFQHPYITDYFDVCLWATVSQEYDVGKILTELLSILLSQIKEKNSFLCKISDVSSVDELGLVLYKSLFGLKYLIILDDIWSAEAWCKMKFFFPDTNNGSRIAVTTRQLHVARHLDSSFFTVSFLDEDCSWDLFCKKTFDDQGCPPELKDIGKKIVENCGGLPLAIIVVGGHLRKSLRTTEYWENVAKNMSSVFNCEENEQCFNILSLSYKYLPVHLKPCFLFMGVFMEDQDIPVSDIVNLWIGEGFIENHEKYSLESIARSYLNDLLQRNLIYAYKRDWVNRNIIACRVHDLVRELCLKIAKKEGFLSVLDTLQAANRESRVVIRGKVATASHRPKIFHVAGSPALVRSLICEGVQLSVEMKLLRVLNKVDAPLANGINFQQLNLRYLKVDVFFKSYLPSSISLLWNLQTLIITGACGSIIAPYEIWEMLQLRRFEVDPLCLPDPLPDQENDMVLEKLLTLSRVVNFRLSEEVCRRIPNINELQVSYCDELSLDYCPHNLGCFQQLKSLECYFDCNGKWHDFASSLSFPNSLTRLRLSDSRLDWEELTTKIGSLPHLETLELFPDSVTGSEWTPSEGGFPRLKNLVIYHCDLAQWKAESFHFPVLEDVSLYGLSRLAEFPWGIGEIPTLCKIGLGYCSLSLTISAMRMVVEQENQGIEGLRLHVFIKVDEETLEGFKQKVEEEGLRSKNIDLNLKM